MRLREAAHIVALSGHQTRSVPNGCERVIQAIPIERAERTECLEWIAVSIFVRRIEQVANLMSDDAVKILRPNRDLET
jgi:hypothetical protein